MTLTFMTSPRLLFTSESVTEGHPDKMCDQISDSVLDAVYEHDPMGRVACETAVKTGFVMLLGELRRWGLAGFESGHPLTAYVRLRQYFAVDPDGPDRDALVDRVGRARELLLILDNCEHLIRDSAGVAESLLRYCARLKILATSREALGAAGESG